jgi:hypothetical protein
VLREERDRGVVFFPQLHWPTFYHQVPPSVLVVKPLHPPNILIPSFRPENGVSMFTASANLRGELVCGNQLPFHQENSLPGKKEISLLRFSGESAGTAVNPHFPVSGAGCRIPGSLLKPSFLAQSPSAVEQIAYHSQPPVSRG